MSEWMEEEQEPAGRERSRSNSKPRQRKNYVDPIVPQINTGEMMSYRGFMDSQPEDVDFKKARQVYDDYKREWVLASSGEQFEQFKSAEWFKDKYLPERVQREHEYRKAMVQRKAKEFHSQLESLRQVDWTVTEQEINNLNGGVYMESAGSDFLELSVNTDLSGAPYFATQVGAHTAYIRAIPADVSQWVLLQDLEQLEGFRQLQVSEPIRSKEYVRYGWVEFGSEEALRKGAAYLEEKYKYQTETSHQLRYGTAIIVVPQEAGEGGAEPEQGAAGEGPGDQQGPGGAAGQGERHPGQRRPGSGGPGLRAPGPAGALPAQRAPLLLLERRRVLQPPHPAQQVRHPRAQDRPGVRAQPLAGRGPAARPQAPRPPSTRPVRRRPLRGLQAQDHQEGPGGLRVRRPRLRQALRGPALPPQAPQGQAPRPLPRPARTLPGSTHVRQLQEGDPRQEQHHPLRHRPRQEPQQRHRQARPLRPAPQLRPLQGLQAAVPRPRPHRRTRPRTHRLRPRQRLRRTHQLQ